MKIFFTNCKHTKNINWIVAGCNFAVWAKNYPLEYLIIIREKPKKTRTIYKIRIIYLNPRNFIRSLYHKG